MTTDKQPATMLVRSLKFNQRNPRFAEFDIPNKLTEDEMVLLLWETMDVMELVQSIAAAGFFPHEQITVAREDDQNIVIDGNRQLAAVRILLDPELVGDRARDIPQISERAKNALQTLPVLEDNRSDAWRYLAFRHMSGPAKWSGYAKAKYISHVHRDIGIPLEDIATQIGDRFRTVQRLFRGLMVLEQAEAEQVYDPNDRMRPRLLFSHLWFGIEQEGIANFISIRPLDENELCPVPKNKLAELGELCVWLYGSKKRNIHPVVKTENPDLIELDAILQSRDGVAALRSTGNLALAFDASRAPAAVFERSLNDAKRSLQSAMAHLTTGYDGTQDPQLAANSVANLADDICEDMRRKRNPLGKQRRQESL